MFVCFMSAGLWTFTGNVHDLTEAVNYETYKIPCVISQQGQVDISLGCIEVKRHATPSCRQKGMFRAMERIVDCPNFVRRSSCL